jgi:hypothetical protein
MEKLTYAEIAERLQKYYSDQDAGVEDFAGSRNFDADLIALVGEIKHVEHDRVNDDYWDVYYFVDHDVYIQVMAYYASHSGVDYYDGWDCLSEVRPVTKTITVYE